MTLEDLKTELVGDWKNALSTSADTTALTLIGPKLLDEFEWLIRKVVSEKIPGDIVETGVWRGGACIWAAAVLKQLGSDKRVYACDSYEGLPPVSSPKETVDYRDAVSLSVSLDEVESNFKKYDLLDRVTFVQGWFKDTMPTMNVPVSILRLDGDMYESTDDVLRYMYDRVSPGGFVIVDDYHLPSCKLAVDELRSRKRLRGKLPVRAGVWWQKPPLHSA